MTSVSIGNLVRTSGHETLNGENNITLDINQRCVKMIYCQHPVQVGVCGEIKSCVALVHADLSVISRLKAVHKEALTVDPERHLLLTMGHSARSSNHYS